MKKVIGVGCFVLLVLACSNNKSGDATVPKAHIFERRMLPGNKLLVSYTYQNGHFTVSDSSVVDNTVISQDSIPVKLFAKNNPANRY
jgi:hypothetical protein